jgi:hypothetical protein
MNGKSNMIAAVAGGIGLAFLGYCVYFDRKRRSDPDFKKKLIESNNYNKKNKKHFCLDLLINSH